MAYESFTNPDGTDVSRLTAAPPKQPTPNAKGTLKNTAAPIYRDGILRGIQFGAPSAEELAREQQPQTPLDGSIYRLDTLTGKVTVERPGQASAVDTTDLFPRNSDT